MLDPCLISSLISPHVIQLATIPSPTNFYLLILGGASAPAIWELNSTPHIPMRSSVCSPPTGLTGRIRTVAPEPQLTSTLLRKFPWPAPASSVPRDGNELLLPCWSRAHAETVIFVIFTCIMFSPFLYLSNCMSTLIDSRFKLYCGWRSVITVMIPLIRPFAGGGGLLHAAALCTRTRSSLDFTSAEVVLHIPDSMSKYCLTPNDMFYICCYSLGLRLQLYNPTPSPWPAQDSNVECSWPRRQG